MKTRFFLLFGLFYFTILTAQVTVAQTTTLYYAPNQAKLTATHQTTLKQWIAQLDTAKIEQIYVDGHADETGSKAYNDLLSGQRAEAVQAFLIEQGVAASLITVRSYGTKKPISEKLSENRRADLSVKEKPKEEPPIVTSSTDTRDFYRKTALEVQEFCIDPTKDTVIQGEKGTLIHLKANSFQKTDAPCVTFQLKEVFLKSEMVLENLTTMADGRILETQGMIYTNAIANGDTLPLLKDMTVLMPTDSVVDKTGVFDGDRDLHSDEINWTLNNSSVLRNFRVKDLNNCLKYNELWKKCQGNALNIGIDSTNLWEYCWECMGCLTCKEKCNFFFCRIGMFPRVIKGIFDPETRTALREMRECLGSDRRFSRMSRRIARRSRRNPSVNSGFSNFRSFEIKKVKEGLIRKEVLENKVPPTAKEQEALSILAAMEKADSLIKSGAIDTELVGKCNELEQLLEQYGVDNVDDLVVAINRPLMDEFGVNTMSDLFEAMSKRNLEEVELAYRNKNISYEDYNFYIFNSSKLGWKNLDVFADIPNSRITEFKVNVPPSETSDCKLIFKDRQFVLRGQIAKDHHYFEGIPKGEKAWLVGIKYVNGQPLFAMKLITISKETQELEFEELSIEELKEKLKVLDF